MIKWQHWGLPEPAAQVGPVRLGRGSDGSRARDGSPGRSCGAAEVGTVAVARMTRQQNEEWRKGIVGSCMDSIELAGGPVGPVDFEERIVVCFCTFLARRSSADNCNV